MKRKKKRCCVKGSRMKQGLYKSRLSELRDDIILVDTPEEAELLILPIEGSALSDEQNDLIRRYEGDMAIAAFPEDLLMDGDDILDKWISGEKNELTEDTGYELEL